MHLVLWTRSSRESLPSPLVPIGGNTLTLTCPGRNLGAHVHILGEKKCFFSGD